MKNENRLIKDISSQIWSLCNRRSELVKAFDPKDFFIKPPQNYRGHEYFDNIAVNIISLSPGINKLYDEFDYLMVKLEKHGFAFEEIQDLLMEEYWSWQEGIISDVVDLFLSLPAKYVCEKLLSKSFDQEDPITDLHSALCGYDGAPLNGISSNDRRIQAWRSWFKINVLKRLGNFEIVDPIDKRLVRKGEYQNGEMHGNVKEYIDGKLTSIAAYKYGEQTGRYQHFRPDGSLEEEGMSEKGSVISKCKILFDKKGKPLNGAKKDWIYGTGNYLNGRRHGKFVKKNQKKETVAVTNFIMGEKDGLHWQNDSSVLFGIKHKELNYKNDELNGPYKYFNDDGQITHEGFYKNGKKHGVETKFYPSGRIRRVSKYIKGELRSWKDYEDE